MPYTLDGNCVKKEGGETVKCHDTVDKARAHLRALQANVDHKRLQLYTQEEVAYTTVSVEQGRACANCRWFAKSDMGCECRIMESWPEDVLPTGYCNEWRESMEPQPEPVPVEIVEDLTAMRATSKPSMLDRLVKSIAKAIVRRDPWLTEEQSGLKVFADGKRWLAWWTNNWYDHEREVFPLVAIDDYLGRVKSGTDPYPELWFSHLKSMAHGKADTVWRVGSIVMAAGSFDDSVLAHKMLAYYRAAQTRGVKLRVSHGFKYPPPLKIKGAYYRFTTHEISPIPEVGAFRAANPYTLWEVKTMNVPEDVKREIAMALSDDGKTVDDATMKRAETVIAAANGENDKAAEEGRQQKNESITPADNAARLDALESKINDQFTNFKQTFENGMSKALGAFETGVKTNVEAATKFEEVSARLDALEAWQTEQKALAPRATRSNDNIIPEDSALAKWLSEQEAKNDNSPLSMVEMITGQKSADIDANQNGGTSNVPTA